MTTDEIFEKLSRYAERIDAGALRGLPASFELTVTGEDGGVISAVREGGRIRVCRQAVPDAACRAVTDKEALGELLRGGTSPLRLLAAGRLKLEGDASRLVRPALKYVKNGGIRGA